MSKFAKDIKINDILWTISEGPKPQLVPLIVTNIDIKKQLDIEGSELSAKIGQLKMKAKDGKMRETDTLDTEGIFRLIESVPSPKAEPFKLWLAKLGREKIDEVFDPSKGIDQMIDFYLKKGYTLEWIETRIKAIIE